MTATVAANTAWMDTGVTIHPGQAVTVTATGRIRVFDSRRRRGAQPDGSVGPIGTYDFGDTDVYRAYPLPCGAKGPAPYYCLIGRIGNGRVFYVGQRRSWRAEQYGKLMLGINDVDFTDNSGHFRVEVSTSERAVPVSFQKVVRSSAVGGRPEPGCSVVVFYVDGLRPDVVREMTAMGHLPWIKRLFVDGGAWLSNAVTAFPSDTITSNGTMWSGCFSDRHGVKGQVRFSRRQLASQSYLDPAGPSRTARLLTPHGIDGVLHKALSSSVRVLRGEAASEQWQAGRTSGTMPLYGYLRAQGRDWATGALPIMTEIPPTLWTHSMAREMPYLRAHEAWKHLDDANARYAIRHLLQRDSPVTVIWLPETDSISHRACRGQFGATRQTIVRADALIGQAVSELEALGRIEKTYFLLISDHGHHGGRRFHLSHFDLGNEVFFRPREVTPSGRWVSGGLGMSVRTHRSWNRHREDGRREFVFIDGEADGAARIFFPKGHYRSGDWSSANQPADLLRYKVADHLPGMNLVELLANATAAHSDGVVQHPIDLVLMKLAEHSVLIAAADRGYAVVDRERNDEGGWVYRYSPVDNVQPTTNGEVAYRFVDDPQVDPLNLLPHTGTEFLREYHDETAWLQATIRTDYPDSVVAMTRHMLWQENLRTREPEYASDLVVTARRGWYFGTDGTAGTTHGYPYADAMRVTWSVAGPNVRRGARIDRPCRLVDLTPTILEMVGSLPAAADFDGAPLHSFYQPTIETVAADDRPIFWEDVDLKAWQSLDYAPVEEYPHKPITINQPTKAFDLNNLAYDVVSVSSWNVFRLLDDVMSPLTKGKPYVTQAVDDLDSKARHARSAWIAQGAQTLNVPDVALGDYSFTSVGNLKRADGVIDWVQSRGRDVDRALARPLGRSSLPGSNIVHGTIDTTQGAFWEVYRFGQRLVVEILDERVLNGVENGTDRTVNSFRKLPAEIVVEH